MEYFLGTIMALGFNFAPRGWAKCEGQLLPISSNQALFSLLGTIYGGDGRTTFGLPDLRGRAAIGAGTGPGLSDRALGQKGGTQSITLTEAHLPGHNHAMQAETKPGTAANPQGNMLGLSPGGNLYAAPDPVANRVMATESISATGGDHAFDNEAPYGVVNWCICVQGMFPSRD